MQADPLFKSVWKVSKLARWSLCLILLGTSGLITQPARAISTAPDNNRTAVTDPNLKAATSLCTELLSVRVGSLLNIEVKEAKALTRVDTWFVSGEVHQQQQLSFACVIEKKQGKMEVTKLELYQVKPSPKG